MKNGFALLLPLGFGSCRSLAGQRILCRRWIADEHQFQHIQKLHEVKKQNKNYVSLTQHPIGVRTEGEGGRVKVHGQVKGCEIIQDKDGVELNTVVVVMTRSGQFEEHQEATYVLLSDG